MENVLIFIVLLGIWLFIRELSRQKKDRRVELKIIKEKEKRYTDERERFNSLTLREKEKENKVNLRKKIDRCFHSKITDLNSIIHSIEKEKSSVRLGSFLSSVSPKLFNNLSLDLDSPDPDLREARERLIKLREQQDFSYYDCDNALSNEDGKKIRKYIEDGINNLIIKKLKDVQENKKNALDDSTEDINILTEDINILREWFLKYSDKPKGKKQLDAFNSLADSFNLMVTQTVKRKRKQKLLDYFRKKAGDYNIGSSTLEIPTENDKVLIRFYFAKIKSNIDNKQYLQIGTTTLEKDLALLSNDVVVIVDMYKDIELESNIALTLQYNLIRKYIPNNYVAEDEFNEFERFDGYKEIVPMKHKTQVCNDIDNVIDNYKDVKFVFNNLILMEKYVKNAQK